MSVRFNGAIKMSVISFANGSFDNPEKLLAQSIPPSSGRSVDGRSLSPDLNAFAAVGAPLEGAGVEGVYAGLVGLLKAAVGAPLDSLEVAEVGDVYAGLAGLLYAGLGTAVVVVVEEKGIGPGVVDWKRHEMGMPVGRGEEDGVLVTERNWRAAVRLVMSEAMVPGGGLWGGGR